MSTPYRVCPNCGCNLDPGERCDCMDDKQTSADMDAGQSAGQLATETGNQRRPAPALMLGA